MAARSELNWGRATVLGLAAVLRGTAVLAFGFFLTSLFLSWYASYDRKPNSIIGATPTSQSQPSGGAAPVAPPTSGGLLDSLKKADQQQQNQPAPSGPQAPRSQ